MTFEITLVLSVLFITIILFVTEKLRVDVVALLVMIALPWLGLISPKDSFTGLSSNAVISIMGIMILGYGIDKSGVMNYITSPIIRIAGTSERKLLTIIASTVGILSAFIQNIGATALFLPAIIKISKRIRISPSKILMPIGFSAILGGTLTLFGSGPLIILNDLLKRSGVQGFGIFDVTPLGLSLLATGILYFLILGRWVLPETIKKEDKDDQSELIKEWNLSEDIYPVKGNLESIILQDLNLWSKYHLHVIALSRNNDILYSPWRNYNFKGDEVLFLSGNKENIKRFVSDYSLSQVTDKRLEEIREQFSYAQAIIPPYSGLVNRTIKEYAFRKNFEVEPVILQGYCQTTDTDFSERRLEAGDILIVHGHLERLWRLKCGKELIILTPIRELNDDRGRPLLAVIGFIGAIILALNGFQLSLSLFSGALFMILTRVVKIDEAYKSIDWRTIFLLAGLIPLGFAMDNTGASKYVAENMIGFFANSHPIIILLVIALLATLFTLFMSNIAATVLLVPLVVIMGKMIDINSSALGLLVAVMASNSFILPTHQVNAFLMGPGGYRNRDYIKSGSIMTLLFMFVSIGIIYFFYL
ncbi:MAG: SLC13 family permease [Spirochaetota bacterium]|nr:SLC13 family permease [Spirochaetota bacterium]